MKNPKLLIFEVLTFVFMVTSTILIRAIKLHVITILSMIAFVIVGTVYMVLYFKDRKNKKALGGKNEKTKK